MTALELFPRMWNRLSSLARGIFGRRTGSTSPNESALPKMTIWGEIAALRITDKMLDPTYCRKHIAYLEERIATLEAYIKQLDLALAVEQATVAGLESELHVVKHNHPDSPAYQPLPTLKFEDGTPKTCGRLGFELGFDKFLKEQGIDNPRQYRRD